MTDVLVAEKKLDKLAAYQLASIAADVAIPRLVDGKVGVHVKMPRGRFKRSRADSVSARGHCLRVASGQGLASAQIHDDGWVSVTEDTQPVGT
jgi:hypothetical protein